MGTLFLLDLKRERSTIADNVGVEGSGARAGGEKSCESLRFQIIRAVREKQLRR